MPVFETRPARKINNSVIRTYYIYYELIKITNNKGIVRKTREFITFADIDYELILGLA